MIYYKSRCQARPSTAWYRLCAAILVTKLVLAMIAQGAKATKILKFFSKNSWLVSMP